jgi:hypothetical protein
MRRTKYTDRSKQFYNIKSEAIDSALARMVKDIKQVAWITMPFLSGAMQKNTKDEKIGKLRYRVLVDTQYASYQEKGSRADGSHKVRRYSTAGTGSGFLRKAGSQVVKDAMNYLKQANQISKL